MFCAEDVCANGWGSVSEQVYKYKRGECANGGGRGISRQVYKGGEGDSEGEGAHTGNLQRKMTGGGGHYHAWLL